MTRDTMTGAQDDGLERGDLSERPQGYPHGQHRAVFKTKREATASLATRTDGGGSDDGSVRTLRRLLEMWLETDVHPRVRSETFRSYATTVRRHLIPGLGHLQVHTLTPAHLHAFYFMKTQSGCGPRTVDLCRIRLTQSLDLAVRLGWVATNVAQCLRRPRQAAQESRTWTLDEARRVIAVAPQSAYGPLWLLALGTGMRRGELLGLRWQDVDPARDALAIRRTVALLDETRPVEQPAKRRREIIVPHPIMIALSQHHAEQGTGDAGHVFTDTAHRPLRPVDLSRDFARLVRCAGVQPIRIHDVRHTYAALAIAIGNPVEVVRESMGYDDQATTPAVPVLPAQRDALARSIADALFTTPPRSSEWCLLSPTCPRIGPGSR